ncbi:MAG: hypothetical protein CG445_1000, partial [Methanosaeta sp. ASM2]
MISPYKGQQRLCSDEALVIYLNLAF